MEANAAEYGIGLVKLMGRYAGFIAMFASLAARDVNICLIPEFPFDLNGPRGLLEFIMNRVKNRRHCIIVVAEGAGKPIPFDFILKSRFSFNQPAQSEMRKSEVSPKTPLEISSTE